jgi:hypothetical protein
MPSFVNLTIIENETMHARDVLAELHAVPAESQVRTGVGGTRLSTAQVKLDELEKKLMDWRKISRQDEVDGAKNQMLCFSTIRYHW